MFSFFLITCLLTFSQGQSYPRASRLKSSEEINVNDITFTTSSPEYTKSSSFKPIIYYNAMKHDYGSKGTLNTKNPSKTVKPYPKTTYLDNYGSITSADEIFITEKPKTSSTFRYKPLRVYNVKNDQNERDGFWHNAYSTKNGEKVTPMHYQQSISHNVKLPKNIPRRYAAKIVPFSSVSPSFSHSKDPTEADTYTQKDKHGFIPSITTSQFSGKEVSEISGGVLTTFPGIKLTETHTFHSDPIKYTTHPEAKPNFSQESKLEEEHQGSLATEDFLSTSGNFRENDESTKESSNQNESVMSKTSTPKNSDKGENNLEEGTDSVENLKTGERVEFQMYGMDGPKSYKFGFDTGKGQNRHFRFEERDKSGKVKGHYGYIDEEGKMRIMKYEADPLTGFRAGPVESDIRLTEDDN